uniref:Immunoglobulin heavy variable 8-2 n=1 Tax=Haplochromis burtoni TaxID=8153 RepID=A0A3Q2VZ34_HAPBU
MGIMEIMFISFSTGVYSIDLIQSDSAVVQPGKSVTITCQVSGYSLTDRNYATGWIRQSEGKTLEWIVLRWGSGVYNQNNALKNKLLHHTYNNSIKQVYLQMNGLTTEDSAVYYCAREPQ